MRNPWQCDFAVPSAAGKPNIRIYGLRPQICGRIAPVLAVIGMPLFDAIGDEFRNFVLTGSGTVV
jgi:hypothetical protein